MSATSTPPSPIRPIPSAFGRANLSNIIRRGDVGYQYTTGVHIYCELRVTEELREAKTDTKALKLLQAIKDYVNYGVMAAEPFNVDLLELQGTLLHFYREGEANAETILSVFRFAHIFTSVVYDRLKKDLGDDWYGFATCIDHGPAIIVRHGTFTATSSAVSLGPAANRPAKQLLYGKTPAGCIDVPSGWASFLEKSRPATKWLTIRLADREWLPFAARIDDSGLRQRFAGLADRYQRERRSAFNRLSVLNAQQLHQSNSIVTDVPYRVVAFVDRFDLDGFSPTVEAAFQAGGDAIDKIAISFGKILEFGDYMQRTTAGSIRLPWAGDCCPLLVPPDVNGNLNHLRTTRWLETAVRWQTFAAGDDAARERGWSSLFEKVAWAVGAACGTDTSCLIAPIAADGRQFLVGVGWPVAASLEGQNLGRGGDIMLHLQDYAVLPDSIKNLFSKVECTEFWKTTNLTLEKMKKAQISGATSKATPAIAYSSTLGAQRFPIQRPYYR